MWVNEKLSTSLKKVGTWVGNFYKCSQQFIKVVVMGRDGSIGLYLGSCLISKLHPLACSCEKRGEREPYQVSRKLSGSDASVQVQLYWTRTSQLSAAPIYENMPIIFGMDPISLINLLCHWGSAMPSPLSNF